MNINEIIYSCILQNGETREVYRQSVNSKLGNLFIPQENCVVEIDEVEYVVVEQPKLLLSDKTIIVTLSKWK